MNIHTIVASAKALLVGAVGVLGAAGSHPALAQDREGLSGRYVVNGAEVNDTLTGLVWRRCSEGQSWTGSTCTGSAVNFTWQGALDRARSATLDGVPWRLPNAKELSSLVHDNQVNPAIDAAIFPGTPSGAFWTSTYVTGQGSGAWVVNFFYGNVGFGGRYIGYAVRLVRAGT